MEVFNNLERSLLGMKHHFREVKNSNLSTSPEKKSIVFLGDNMIKYVNGYEISRELKNSKVVLRSFSGSKFRSMEVHMKPPIRENPDHILLHNGANDLHRDRAPDLIAMSIIALGIMMKSNSQNLSILNIIILNDNLNDEAIKVHLNQFCIEKNVFRIYKNFPLLKHQ